ncbi:MAG: hypothetical protein U9O65_07125 [Thermotogota bacterium]|nr:hypothetical protein [Thermotogota bacterium]
MLDTESEVWIPACAGMTQIVDLGVKTGSFYGKKSVGMTFFFLSFRA